MQRCYHLGVCGGVSSFVTVLIRCVCFSKDLYSSEDVYTLSHHENDRDVTERAQGYTLQDASFMRQSRCSFLNARAMTSVFLQNTR